MQFHSLKRTMSNNKKFQLPLRTPRLILKNFVEADWQKWRTLRNLPETREYNQYTEPLSSSKGREIVRKFLQQREQEPRLKYTLTIYETTSDAFVGYVNLTVFDDVDKGLSEISYCLYPSEWGNGYTTEAVKAMTEFALDGLKLHRVEAGCSTENIASWRVLEKAGYMQEGRIRQDMQVRKDVWHDEFIYGILETDKFERVLR